MRRGLALLVTGCLTLSACGGGGSARPNDAAEADPTATLRYVTVAGVTSFDPHKTVSASDFILLNYVYDRLVHVDAEGKAVPGLANSWTFSDDMRTLTLSLRDGISFPDGTPFDAEAVKANLERAMEPDSITAAPLAAIEKVTAVDKSTIELGLREPGVNLVLTLSDLAGMMVTPTALAKPESLASTPNGIGRFTLTSAQPGARYAFGAVDNYWDPDALPVAGLNVEVITDPQTALNGLSSDQFDCALVSPGMIDPAKQIPNAVVAARTVLTQTVLVPNQSKSKFGDPRVRRALNLAIDRTAVLQAAQEGHGAASTGLFPDDYWVPNDDVSKLLAHDPDQARSLLADAGLQDGFKFTAITLTIPQFLTTAEIIKSQLAEVGIDMTIKALPPADAGVSFLRGEGDALISAWTGRPDPAMLFANYFSDESPSNVSKVEPEGFDEALSAANAEEDPGVRGKLLAKVQKIVLENGSVVPVTFNAVGTVCTADVIGYKAPVLGVSEFRGVGLTR